MTVIADGTMHNPAPASVVHAYTVLMERAILQLRYRLRCGDVISADELHDYLDALHNVPIMLRDYGGWHVEENIDAALARYDRRWLGQPDAEMRRSLLDLLRAARTCGRLVPRRRPIPRPQEPRPMTDELQPADDLIFDVGMNNGDDTAYYLHKGYRVVAVEADPTCIERVRPYFAEQIADGRLTLVNAAIADREGTATFYVCPNMRVWNSMDPNFALGRGQAVREIEIPCVTPRALMEQHGVPHYFKIDIEGQDHVCLAGLDPACLPTYTSFEMYSLGDLAAAAAKGYNRFKLIDQRDFRALTFTPFPLGNLASKPYLKRLVKRRAPGLVRWLRPPVPGAAEGPGPPKAFADEQWRPPAAVAGGAGSNAWHFPEGSSGPFGDDLPGRWLTLEEVAFSWSAFMLGHTPEAPGLSVWHDIHATRK